MTTLTEAQIHADARRTNALREAWDLYSNYEDPDCEQPFTGVLMEGLVCGQDCEHGSAAYPPASHSYPDP